MYFGCEGSAIAQGDALDRTSLPIQPPVSAPVTELDARNVTPPPPFNIAPPEGAPNVVIVLIDDIGFGASISLVARPTTFDISPSCP